MTENGDDDAPDARGDLIRTLPGDTKAAMPLPRGRFKPWEEWAWDQLSCTGEVDMSDVPENRRGGEDVDKAPVRDPIVRDGGTIKVGEDGKAELVPLEDWPAWQRLSPEFLQLILLHPTWRDSKARARVNIDRALIDGRLDLENESIRGDLGFHSCRLEGGTNLLGTRIEGGLFLNGSAMSGTLDADRLETGGGVFLRGGAVFRGDVRLLGARIGGNLDCDGSRFEAALRADGFETGGDVYLCDVAVFKTGVTFAGARIGQQLQLWGSAFSGPFNLSGARIDDELWLDETSVPNPSPTWGENAFLNLQNARLGALQGSLDAWKTPTGRFVPRDLDGLTFGRAGGGVGGDCLEDADEKDLVKWLEDDLKKDGEKPDPRQYSPSPYRALATALDAAGHRAKARHIRWALARREKRSLSWSNLMKYFTAVSGLVIGYGFQQARGALCFFGLVLGFAWIGQLWAAGWQASVPSLAGLVDYLEWARFSLSNAVPIVELDPIKEEFLENRFGDPVPEGVRWTFWGQRLAGLLLLSMIIAGLTGWAQRRGE